MPGTLYIVATPIGNLEDITLRAIRTLGEVDIILAEDTRVTKKLLTHLSKSYQLKAKKLVSYHQHSDKQKRLQILNYLLGGKNIALVTDAGTPGISDPGNELIDFLYQNTSALKDSLLKVVPIPGASALTTALSVSGFPTNKFVFIGFLPKKKRIKLFKWLQSESITFAFYESPKRLLKSLAFIEEFFRADTNIFIARELTKMHESLYRGTLSEVRAQLAELRNIKGEVVVVVNLA